MTILNWNIDVNDVASFLYSAIRARKEQGNKSALAPFIQNFEFDADKNTVLIITTLSNENVASTFRITVEKV